MKGLTARMLEGLGLPHVTLMTGTLLKARSVPAIVTQKVKNFQQLRQIFPDVDFVILGDSGQGDAAFAAVVMSLYPVQVRLCCPGRQ